MFQQPAKASLGATFVAEFREKFFATTKSNISSLSSFNSLGSIVWRADINSFQTLQKLFLESLQKKLDLIVHQQIDASNLLLEELKSQEAELNYLIEKFDSYKPNPENLANELQKIADYLGLEFSYIRWLVEIYSSNSKKQVQDLLNSFSQQTLHDWKEAIKCFEIGEYKFAKEKFNIVLNSNRTNYFAYQYLAFIAALENDVETSLSNFKLARKIADTPYHQALALSHLVIGCDALEEKEKALKLAEQATEIYSNLARLWYQQAIYQAAVSNKEKCLFALNNVLQCDWQFWGVLIANNNFSNIEINSFFSQLRQQQQTFAKQAISNLEKAIKTVKKIGASYSLVKVNDILPTLTERLAKNNIFNYLEVISEASSWQDNIFQSAEKHLREQISSKRSSLAQQENNKNRELKDLDLPINKLLQERKELELIYNKRDLGCGGYILLNVFSFILFILFVILIAPKILLSKDSLNFFTIAIIFIISTIFSIFAPIIFNNLSYIKKVSRPITSIDREIQKKKKEAKELKSKLEEDYKSAKLKLETELKDLDKLLELCQNKQSL